jgi:hypothetical protein
MANIVHLRQHLSLVPAPPINELACARRPGVAAEMAMLLLASENRNSRVRPRHRSCTYRQSLGDLGSEWTNSSTVSMPFQRSAFVHSESENSFTLSKFGAALYRLPQRPCDRLYGPFRRLQLVSQTWARRSREANRTNRAYWSLEHALR